MYVLSRNISIGIITFIVWSGCSTPATRVVEPAPAVSSSVNNQRSGIVIPDKWKKIDADGKFSFYLPPDMRETGRGIENYHREYTNGRMQVSFDYEPFGILAYQNRERAYGKDFQERSLEVDGRKWFIFFYQSSTFWKRKTYNADLHVGDLPNSDVILWMRITSFKPAGIKTAETIFSTVQFP